MKMFENALLLACLTVASCTGATKTAAPNLEALEKKISGLEARIEALESHSKGQILPLSK